MGFIGRVLSFVRAVRSGAKVSDVKSDTGGGDIRTAQHFAPVGDDSHPLVGDYEYLGTAPQRGRVAVLWYVDPKNDSKASAGEVRRYARDSSGASVVELWLKNDGSVVLQNALGSLTLGADGSILGQNEGGMFSLLAGGNFTANGVIITPDGKMTVPTQIATPSILVDGIEAAGHTHAQGNDSAGNSEQNVGPMQ